MKNILNVNIKTAVPNASQYGAKLGYTTYEAEQGELKNVLLKMPLLRRQNTQLPVKQRQAYVDLPTNASVSFIAQADANAVTVRYTVPDGESGKVEVKSIIQ
ncbi:hypothetical protein [Neisseria subflava]|uniref:hypothetical protein n=1 Tax=Neisseria subflava TaxID=28449 RepID=UPI002029E14E|nr:hypothetical protein [Neisseria subflava]